jgi:electron transfer flavoprotein beta subunit
MKILVPTKRVPDTDQKIRVRADGLNIETAMLPFVVNPFDAIALEESLRIREEHDAAAEIVAVGIGGDEYEAELRTALAMGADRALLVQCAHSLDPWNVSRILQAIVRREQPDVVLMGKQAVDDDANQTAQFLAALLDWPQATFASKIKFSDGSIVVCRETDLGIETIRVQLPAVVSTDLRLNEPRYASLPSILKAKKKPIDRIALAELDVPVEPKVRVIGMQSVATARSCTMVQSVEELAEQLRERVDSI